MDLSASSPKLYEAGLIVYSGHSSTAYDGLISTAKSSLGCKETNTIGAKSLDCLGSAAQDQPLAETIFFSSNNKYIAVASFTSPAGAIDQAKLAEQMAKELDIKLSSN